MSANAAQTRAEERVNARLDQAVASGLRGMVQKSMAVTLHAPPGRNITLVKADGEPTREGTYYYGRLGIEPPSIYPYEQPLVNSKWVRGFDNKKHLVRRWASNEWKVTAKGANYFRYNQDIYHVFVPLRIAFPPHSTLMSQDRVIWRIPAEIDRDMYGLLTDAPMYGEIVPFAVAALRGVPQQRGVLPLLATDAAREAHVRDAAHAWLESDRVSDLECRTSDGVIGLWKLIRDDSAYTFVWDKTRPLRITRVKVNVYDREQPNTDAILERPLREFWCVPDNCWRPWDLHPGTFAKTGICAVNMLHSCFVKRAKRPVVDATTGRKMRKDVYVFARTGAEIGNEMDESLPHWDMRQEHTRSSGIGASMAVRQK